MQRTGTPNQLAVVAPGGTGAAPGAAQVLTNVAKGALTATSTDAVNGSQLFTTNQSLTSVTSQVATQTTQIGNIGATTATALGSNAAYDPATGKITGFSQSVNGVDAVGMVGAATQQTTVGGALSVLNNSIANTATIAVKYDAAGGSTITLGATGGVLPPKAPAVKITNLAPGALTSTSSDAVNGSQLYTTNQSVGTLSTEVTNLSTNVSNGTAGPVQRTGTANQVAVVAPGGTGAAPGTAQTLTNVAAGALNATSTDAVNGSQLFATNTTVGALGTQVTNLATNVSNLSTNVSNLATTISNGTAGPVQRTGTANQLALVAAGGTGAAPGAAQSLTNIAAGNLAAGSTDAVNGGQLFATNQAISNITSGQAGPFASNQAATKAQPTASGADALAGGFGASAAGAASSVVGNQATDNGVANSTVVGNGANVKAGVTGSNVALGQGSTVDSTAVGTTGATISGKDYTFAGTAPAGSVSVGSVGNERTVTNVAAGRLNATSTDAVNGSQLFATNTAVNSLASNLGGGGELAVKYDSSGGAKGNTITLQGGDPSAPVLISNVKAGVADTDAANLGQVKQAAAAGTATAVSTANSYTDLQVGAAFQTSVAYTNQMATQTLQQANSYTDMRFGQLSQQIGEVQKEARQAAAIGLAASSLRYDDRPGKLSASMGGGMWKGYAAGAMGLGYTSENQRVRANVSATTTGDNWGVGAGLTFTLN